MKSARQILDDVLAGQSMPEKTAIIERALEAVRRDTLNEAAKAIWDDDDNKVLYSDYERGLQDAAELIRELP